MGNTTQTPLIQDLIRITSEFPDERKILIVDHLVAGHEILRTLARETGGWIGWEATTLYRIAHELSFVNVHETSGKVAGNVERRVLINKAFDNAVRSGQVKDLAAFKGSPGFRRLLVRSLLELRGSGIAPQTLTASGNPVLGEIGTILNLYHNSLNERSALDTGSLYETALRCFDTEADFVLGNRCFVAPLAGVSGLRASLLQLIMSRGAISIGGHTGEPDWGLYNGLDIFAAATPSDEIREVLRRCIDEGLRWDDVAIATTDQRTYAVTLDVLSRQADVPLTVSEGMQIHRTRIGRSLNRWLTWISEGMPADILRQAFEGGELKSVVPGISAQALGRELRRARIGWGRDRYESFIQRVRSGEYPPPPADVNHQGVAVALADFLEDVISVLPSVPVLGGREAVLVSPAVIARATQRWMSYLPNPDQSDIPAQITAILQDIEQHDTQEMAFSAAVSLVSETLSTVRGWPSNSGGDKPWHSSPGAVHLCDITEAPHLHRKRIFVVGMDSERGLGTSMADPILSDSLRSLIREKSKGECNAEVPPLMLSAEKNLERSQAIMRAFYSMRGTVTLSYSISGSMSGSELGPSPVLLSAFRNGNAESGRRLSFSDLRAYLKPISTPVPGASHPLDSRDVWLQSLTDGPLLLAGEVLTRQAFPSLNRGLSLRLQHDDLTLTPHVGKFRDWAGSTLQKSLMDDLSGPVSPSAIEKLSQCPLGWLYRYGIRLFEPDDPTYDPDGWLDPGQRGGLLHEIFEKFAGLYMNRQNELVRAPAATDLEQVIEEVLDAWRENVPPPGEHIYNMEAEEIRDSARTFLQQERKESETADAAQWQRLEYSFGFDDTTPGEMILDPETTLKIRGRVDRIDVLADGTLRVIDYKTGSPRNYLKKDSAPLNGGRLLQAALYLHSLESLLDRKVSIFEYRFPTQSGDRTIISYTRDELSETPQLISNILQHAEDGSFIPTNDSTDCRYCDYKPVCRSEEGLFGACKTPRAEWAKANAPDCADYELMLLRRSKTASRGRNNGR